MSLHVPLRRASNSLAVTLLAAAVCAVPASAQQSPKAQANPAQAPPGKVPAVKTTPPATPQQAAPQQAAPAAGMVVFVDPVTGQIRQPDAAEIGTLTGAGNGNARTTLQSAPAPAHPP